MLVKELFDFVTDASITEDLAERYLCRALAIAAERRRAICPPATASAASAAVSNSEHKEVTPEGDRTGAVQEISSGLQRMSIGRVQSPGPGRDAVHDELERLAHEDRVFKKVAIPRTLADVPTDVSERDFRAARRLNKLEGPLSANNSSQHQVFILIVGK